MRRMVQLVGSTAVALALTAPLAQADVDPRASEAGQAIQSVNQALKRLVRMEGGPPGAIAVVQDRTDKRRVAKAGFGNLMPAERPHATDHMRLASVSKAFTAAVALSLVERSALSLETTIGERLPDLPTAWHAVTLRQLLNHTSGVPNYTEDPDFAAFITANPQASLPPRALLDFIAGQPLLFAPGSSYDYSNSDNIIVALMAEAATGTSYDTLVATHVFNPLNLAFTSPSIDATLPEPFIHGYDVTPGLPPEDITAILNPVTAGPSGNIQSTPADLNRFIRGYVGGALFGPEQRSQQFMFVAGGESDPPGPGTNSAGLGLFKYETDCGTVFGHTGSFPGYTQFAAAKRNGQASATVSINSTIGPGDGPLYTALVRAQRRAICAALST